MSAQHHTALHRCPIHTHIHTFLQSQYNSHYRLYAIVSQGDGEQDEEDKVESRQLRVSRRQKVRPGIVELRLQLEVHKVWT